MKPIHTGFGNSTGFDPLVTAKALFMVKEPWVGQASGFSCAQGGKLGCLPEVLGISTVSGISRLCRANVTCMYMQHFSAEPIRWLPSMSVGVLPLSSTNLFHWLLKYCLDYLRLHWTIHCPSLWLGFEMSDRRDLSMYPWQVGKIKL